MARATPTLTPTDNDNPRNSKGLVKASINRMAIFSRVVSRVSLSGSTKNSSPPKRATKSPSRNSALTLSATSINIRSPVS